MDSNLHMVRIKINFVLGDGREIHLKFTLMYNLEGTRASLIFVREAFSI